MPWQVNSVSLFFLLWYKPGGEAAEGGRIHSLHILEFIAIAIALCSSRLNLWCIRGHSEKETPGMGEDNCKSRIW
jgi:hypothetical protein